ncbi:MAG TPA: hypothetical protein VM261_30445 [Kofleriaceae bacterium]|nr:hypothetical protein [Kofleriaceae bacterium]
MLRRSGLSLLFVAAFAWASAAPAVANGRMPASFKVRFRPGSQTDILAGVTFGLMLSRDDGTTWRWICEAAVGFEGTFDPDYEFAPNGTIWATTFSGLRYTRDGCQWQAVGAPLGGGLVTAVKVADDGTVYAGFADPVEGSSFYKSTNDGMTFVPAGTLTQSFDWFTSIEVAPSAQQNLYVAGYKFQGTNPPLNMLLRSSNGGTSFESLPVTAFAVTNVSELQIAAISPTNPDQVFVRVTLTRSTIGEALYRTDNWSRPLNMGGPTWTKVLDLPDYITGTAVRQNGEVFVTTTTTGLQKSTDGGMTFTAVPGVSFEGQCLIVRPTDQSLWACANNLPPDRMAVGRSSDGMAEWLPKLQYKDIDGPVRCDPGTTQFDDCQATQWCVVAETHGASTDEISCAADAGVDGPGGPPPKDGCCNSSTTPGSSALMSLIVMLMLMLRSKACRACRASIGSPTGRSSTRSS